MSAEFQPPPRNMVQDVRNIIDGYKMGAVRALAQDPVQNSLDAYGGGGGPVRVVYELLERALPNGEPLSLLTVTDSNTTGLRGPALSLADLQTRGAQTGYLELEQDENWAAWEAMGYTKAGEDKLGSRGQGKAAFLYHSRRPLGLKGPGGVELEGMVMLYDTLLADGTYRLGVRLAQPADLVKFPPLEGESARRVVESSYAADDDSFEIPLGLEPLAAAGTRIIVPFLSSEALDALRSGELHRWLERCWWRAIQIGRLEIVMRVDGTEQTIGVPKWWRDRPWEQSPLPANVLLKENEQVDPNASGGIKRIVLFHDPTLKPDEIDDIALPQYAGVQLLRGQQWIETLGTRERFGDLVPGPQRDGFRGFVEFDRSIDRELRERDIESPQHDGFSRKTVLMRQIDLVITQAVREFAEAHGWVAPEKTSTSEDHAADDLLRQITELFVVGGPKKDGGTAEQWSARLDIDYPAGDSARVDWGEELTNVSAICKHDPTVGRREITFTLCVVDPLGEKTTVATRQQRSSRGIAGADFPDLAIVKIGAGTHEVACSMIGRHRLVVECLYDGDLVASSSRNLYVQVDPPEPLPQQPVSLEVTAENADAARVRINDGEHINVSVTIKNRRPLPIELTVEASLGDLLLHDGTSLQLPPRVVGDTPPFETLTSNRIEVSTSTNTDKTVPRVYLEPGRNMLRVDIRDASGQVVASAAKAIWVEADPDDGGPDLPFRMKPRDPATPAPIWELSAPHGDEPDWVLEYTRTHPTYRAAQLADQVKANGHLAGRKLFYGEMICSALIEWSLIRFRQGDETGFQQLLDRAREQSGQIWEGYRTKLEELQDCGDDLEAGRLTRAVVSLMLYAVQPAVPAP